MSYASTKWGVHEGRVFLAMEAGDFSTAIEAYERAYALGEGRIEESSRAMLRIGVGTALYGNGEYEAAREELLHVRETAQATTRWKT